MIFERLDLVLYIYISENLGEKYLGFGVDNRSAKFILSLFLFVLFVFSRVCIPVLVSRPIVRPG